MKKFIFLVISVILSVYAISAIHANKPPIKSVVQFNEPEFYTAEVWVYKNGKLVGHSKNTLTIIGRNFTQQQLINPQSTNKTQYISLSSVSGDCTETATKLANEITTSDLARAQCTLTSINASSWSCEHTFTATQSHSNVQVAGYHWYGDSGSDGNLFACAQFTSVNLEANDQLTIRWNVTIGGA